MALKFSYSVHSYLVPSHSCMHTLGWGGRMREIIRAIIYIQILYKSNNSKGQIYAFDAFSLNKCHISSTSHAECLSHIQAKSIKSNNGPLFDSSVVWDELVQGNGHLLHCLLMVLQLIINQ